MAITVTNIACMSQMNGPLDLLTCLNTVSGSLLWTMVMYAFIVMFVVGWSQLWGISRGLMLGGFFGSMLGAVLWILSLISTANLFVAVLCWLTGIVLIIVDNNRG